MDFIAVDGREESDVEVQGDESDSIEGRPRSLALGRAAKIAAACAGVAGLAVCALAWKASSPHPSFRKGAARAVVSFAEDNTYDCYAEVQNWRIAWSENQKEYCCLHTHVGCAAGKQPQSVASELTQLEDITNFPVSVDTSSFDCAQGFRNWQDGWSKAKKKWCCKEYEMACSNTPNYLGWLIMIFATLVVVGAASVLICLVVRKRSRDEELRNRWDQFESKDKSRRCCTGMFQKEESSFAWFKPKEERGCSTCCGDRDQRSKNKWLSS